MGLKKYLILTHDLQERKVVGGALCGFLSWIRKLFTPLFLFVWHRLRLSLSISTGGH